MRNRMLYILTGKVFAFIFTAFLGFTIASFLFIEFDSRKIFTWQSYWMVAKIALLVMAFLIILRWIFKPLHDASK